MATSIASATTRKLASPWPSRFDSDEKSDTTHCGTSNASRMNGTVARIAPPVALRNTWPTRPA